MNANDFLNIARQKISNNPQTRLAEPARTALADPNCLIDVHAHIFDRKCLNVPYILLRMAKSKLGLEMVSVESAEQQPLIGKSEEEIYKNLKKLNKKENWEKLDNELESTLEIIGDESENVAGLELFGMELKEAMKVLQMANMQEVLDFYLEKFAVKNLEEFKNRPFVTGILLMDLETGWEMKTKKRYFEQVDEVKEISKVRPILPFFAVDPRRADATDPNENLYDLFIKAFTGDTSYFGVKCYPSLGYLPSDARLAPIFQICAEKNIPVLSHCGGETVSTFKKRITVRNSTGEIQFTIPGDSRTERARFLNDPAHWDMVLVKNPNLKLNLGHFGGDTNWELLGTNQTNQRIEKIMDMMRSSNGKVYADFSFNVVEEELFDTFEAQLTQNPDIAARTMYGTDYWVVLPKGNLLGQQGKFLNKLKNHQKTLLQSVPRSYLFD
jgi:predicted TIM-barrel fold metal-dependent hydrolase